MFYRWLSRFQIPSLAATNSVIPEPCILKYYEIIIAIAIPLGDRIDKGLLNYIHSPHCLILRHDFEWVGGRNEMLLISQHYARINRLLKKVPGSTVRDIEYQVHRVA